MKQISVIFVTVGSEEQAITIARTLVEERLVACVNIIPRIRSIYRWQGEICDDEEYFLIMKTPSADFPLVRDRVRVLHRYEVPEIVSFPLAEGLPEYLQWVANSTEKTTES